MAVSSHFFGLAQQSLWNGEINYLTGSAKAMLVTSSYTPNQDTHRYKSSVTGEAVGTGYTARGQALASKTVTYSAGSNVLALSCANPSWATATVTARYLVVYVDTGTDSTSPLIGYVDFGSDVTSSGGTFAYTVPTAGLITSTAA